MRPRHLLVIVGLLAPCLLWAGETNLALTIDGVTYSNVTWGAATPTSVKMFHAAGVATIPLQRLPGDLQERFGYDPAKAAAYRAANVPAQDPPVAKLDRDATAEALGRAVYEDALWKFADRVRLDRVDDIRDRYKQLLELQKTGHADYRAAINVYVEACKRAIEYHYELKREKPEYRDADNNLKSFRPTRNTVQDNLTRQALSDKKADADSFHNNCLRLRNEANKAWDEGRAEKEKADDKSRPKPTPPKRPSNPYLEEVP